MDRPHIRRLARTDQKTEHVLLNIRQTGKTPLDVKLVGTDQEHVYHGALADANVKSLQASHHAGDLHEWKAIVTFALWQRLPDEPASDSLRGLETVAAIKKDILTVTLRKNVAGITQKLGEIKLNRDDEREEIGAFDWVDAAVATSDELRDELERLNSSVAAQKAEVEKLSAQLDELEKAKKAHEDELLGKFVALLNAKKLKIRDQQRLLESAKIDPTVAEAIGKARGSSNRAAGSSRKGKRKADAAESASDEEMEEAKEGDSASVVASDEEAMAALTPDLSDDDATASEADEPQSSAVHSRQQDNGAGAPPQPESEGNMDIDKIGPPPPRRDLPFNRKPAKTSTATAKPQDDDDVDDDDEETDDEL